MKNTKKFALIGALACAFVLAIALTACGGQSNNNESASTDAEATTEEATTETADATAADGEYTLVEDGVITCASDLECPPFSSYAVGTSDPEGFEIDLMAAIAEKMGLKSKWLPKMDFDVVLSQVPEGTKFDVGVANITINDERKESFDFSDPYYIANIAFVTRKDSEAKSSEEFNSEDMRIGVQAGTTGEAWARENLPNATIKSMIPSNAMLSVQTGGDAEDALDAMVCDLPVANSLIGSAYEDLQILEEIPTGDEFGIAISKKNPQLTAAINKALAELKEDGTIDALVEKWLA